MEASGLQYAAKWQGTVELWKYERNKVLTFCELLLYLEKVKKVQATASDVSDLLEEPDT